MIAKVESENGTFVRWDDCKSACVTEDKDGPENSSEGEKSYVLICHFLDGTNCTYPLDKGDHIYFMNNEGRTIDQDMRMCS